MPTEIVEPLETLMFEAIGLTTIALSVAAAGELTLPQWRALVVIGRARALRVGDIAATIGMTLPSTSRLVRRLERNGLVTTGRDESDRRATLVQLSPEGRVLREKVVQCRRSMIDEALASRASVLPRGLAAGLRVIAVAFQDYK